MLGTFSLSSSETEAFLLFKSKVELIFVELCYVIISLHNLLCNLVMTLSIVSYRITLL